MALTPQQLKQMKDKSLSKSEPVLKNNPVAQPNTNGANTMAKSIDDKVQAAMMDQYLRRKPKAAAAPETKPEPKAKPKKVEVTIQTGFKAASDLFTGLPFTRDHAVRVFDPSEIDPDLSGFVPDRDPNYVLQTDALEELVASWSEGQLACLVGPTGSGKSTLVEQACAYTGRPYVRVNMTGDVDTAQLLGMPGVGIDPKTGNSITTWTDGVVTEVVKKGGVLLIDEYEWMPSEIFYALQWLMEYKNNTPSHRGKLFLKEMPAAKSSDRLIEPHKDFILVMAGNTVGQGDTSGKFAGAQVLSTASLNRIDTWIELGYLDRTHEIAIIKKQYPGLADGKISDLLKFSELVRAAYEQGNIAITMSPRQLLNIARKMEYWGDELRAIRSSFFNGLTEEDKKLANEICQKVYGKELVE